MSHVVTSPPTPLADPSASARSMVVCGLWRIRVPTAGPRRAHAVDNQHLVKAAGGRSLRAPCPAHHFHNLPQDLGETRSCSLSLASAPLDCDSTPGPARRRRLPLRHRHRTARQCRRFARTFRRSVRHRPRTTRHFRRSARRWRCLDGTAASPPLLSTPPSLARGGDTRPCAAAARTASGPSATTRRCRPRTASPTRARMVERKKTRDRSASPHSRASSTPAEAVMRRRRPRRRATNPARPPKKKRRSSPCPGSTRTTCRTRRSPSTPLIRHRVHLAVTRTLRFAGPSRAPSRGNGVRRARWDEKAVAKAPNPDVARRLNCRYYVVYNQSATAGGGPVSRSARPTRSSARCEFAVS